MKKKLCSTILTLSLFLLLLTPASGAEQVVPTPPEWVPDSEYCVFEHTQAYEPENWEMILQLREAVAQGDVALGAISTDLRNGYIRLVGKRIFDSDADPGLLLELALIETRLLSYDDGNLYPYRTWLHRLSYCLPEDLTSEQQYVLCLWETRGLLRSDGATEEFLESLERLSAYPQFSLDTLINTAIFSKEEQPLLLETVSTAWQQYKNRVELYLDGAPLSADVAPEVRNQRTMVPIRTISEAIGADVLWEPSTQSITLTRAGQTIVMTLGKTSAVVDGTPVEMDAAPYAVQGRTLIPVRYVAEFFGQHITWDNDTRRAEITEDKSGTDGSNLEAWALPMGAMRGALDRDDPALFGQTPRSAEHVKEIRARLVSDWGIHGREELISTIQQMTVQGHNVAFLTDAAYIKSLSKSEYEAYCSHAGMDAYMFPYTVELSEKWGERGILCWDLFRMSNLAQWGYTAGYLTYTEALRLVEPAAQLLYEHFSSWDEAYQNYLDGYCWWARIDVEDWYAQQKEREENLGLRPPVGYDDLEPWEKLPRASSYVLMKLDEKTATLFDDTLFQIGVIGLPT